MQFAQTGVADYAKMADHAKTECCLLFRVIRCFRVIRVRGVSVVSADAFGNSLAKINEEGRNARVSDSSLGNTAA